MTEYFVALNRGYDIIFVNRALAEASGRTLGSIVGRNHWDLWPEMRGSVVEESYERAFSTGLPARFEYYSARSGVWVEVNAYPSQGCLHVYFRDVTIAKREAADHAEAEEHYRSIVDALPQIAWVADVDGTASYFNARWYEYTGLDPSQMYEASTIVHPEDLHTTIERRTKAYSHGETYQTEVRLRRHDGEYRWHLTRAEPIRDADGRAVRFVGTSTDVHNERLATNALREAEESLRLMTDSVPVLIAFVDSDLRYRFVNRMFEEWFAVERDQVLGLHLRDFLGQASFEKLSPYAERALRGEKLTFEWWVDYPTGRRFVSVTYVPRQSPSGGIDGFYVLSNDFTERKRNEDALRFIFDLTEATRDLRDPDEIMSTSVRLLGQHVKVARCTYSEVAEDGETLMNMHEWAPDSSPVAGQDSLLSQFGSFALLPLSQGQALVSSDIEREVSDPTGEALVAIQARALVASPLIKNGRLVAIMAIHSDQPRSWTQEEINIVRLVVERCWAEIERAKAEQGLRESEARIRQILEAATVGVIVNDRLGQFSYANPPLLSMLGYARADLDAGKLNWRLIQAPDRVEGDDVALDQLRTTGACEPYESELIARDGRRVPVYMGAAYITDQQGEGLTGAAFVTDLTPLKAAQLELEELNRELDQRVRERTAELRASNETLEAYSYHVAHDLRTPLRAVVSTSRLIEDDYGQNLPDKARRLLRRQVDAANKLARLIDDLLKISRLPREEMEKQSLDVTQLAEEVAVDAVTAHPGTTVQIEVQSEMRAQADPRLLRLALLNLVENAVKYSPRGGRVRVGQQPDGIFFVADEGIGIDMAYAQKIFEPFQRLHRDEEFAGTGIGLSNVSQVVTRHGGRVWLEAEPGKGSTFFFTLA